MLDDPLRPHGSLAGKMSFMPIRLGRIGFVSHHLQAKAGTVVAREHSLIGGQCLFNT
jgi:hypothetical protein